MGLDSTRRHTKEVSISIKGYKQRSLAVSAVGVTKGSEPFDRGWGCPQVKRALAESLTDWKE
jgi:hypothetical protein